MNQKLLDKNKTKELEWDRFVKENHTNFSKDANGIKYEFYEDDLLEFITQQRTELLSCKTFKNPVCPKCSYALETDDLKDVLLMQRTELLEEILGLECLKEEDESGWKGNSFDNTGNGNKSIRNQLRKEIRERLKQITNLKEK